MNYLAMDEEDVNGKENETTLSGKSAVQPKYNRGWGIHLVQCHSNRNTSPIAKCN